MGEGQIDWIANEGVRIDRIVEHVAAQSLTPEQQHLRSEMLEAPTSDTTPSKPKTEPTETLPGVAATALSRDEVHTRAWTVPHQTTVRADTAGKPVIDRIPQVTSHDTSPVDRNLQQALQELAAARSRPYYDEAADMRSRSSYYSVLKQSSTPRELFVNLSSLICSTHTQLLEYEPSLHVYPWVDLQPDLLIQSIYSGKTYDPEQLIREDALTLYERMERIYDIITIRSAPRSELLQQELGRIETELPYNCEHVVPQSWFGEAQPMRGDLHHLFACEATCNSFRGNNAYADFPGFGETVRTECGILLEQGFEPCAGKGAVARASLYFLLRYPEAINSNKHKFDRTRLAVLLDWHEQFPVTVYEKHRNMAIFDKQGNRNPLIDFPEIARTIGFSPGLGW
jgi:endonuclease I